jgi:hypothetical protein
MKPLALAGEEYELVGVDKDKVPLIEVKSYVKTASPNLWEKCDECGEMALWAYGKTYYHKLSCKFSNGIGYTKDERRNTTLPHHPSCDCSYCQPPKKDKK